MNDIVAKASWHQTVPVNSKMMKIQSAIIVLILQLFLLSAYAQTEQEFWDFEGTGADVEIYGIPNQGIFGSSWNGTSFNGDETDGTGVYVLAGDSTTFTRKLPAAGTANAQAGLDEYASPATAGRYRLEVNFNSWNFDAASNGDTWALRVNESAAAGGSTIAQIILQVNSTSTTRIRFAGDFTSGSAFRNVDFGLSQVTPVSAAIEFDFDQDTATYYLNGEKVEVFTDFIGADIGQLLYVKTGNWSAAASSVAIGSMGYYRLPEKVIDEWTFSEANGTNANNTLSNNGVALGGGTDTTLAQTSNGEMLFGSANTDGSGNVGLFSATDLTRDPITSGKIEVAYEVTSADFTNTKANGTSEARAGFRVQDRRDGNVTFAQTQFIYDPETDQYLLRYQTFNDSTENVVIQDNGSAVLAVPLSVRMVIDLDNPGDPGSFSVYYAIGNNAEQVATESGTLGLVFAGSTQIDAFGLANQITNGGADWRAGDTVTVDNVVVSEAVDVVPSIVVSSTEATVSFATLNGTRYSVLAADAPDGNFVEVGTVAGDGNEVDVIDSSLQSSEFYKVRTSR
jgi:hypothetical protein